MQLDAILEVAIGLVMMWLILSVATMEIQSWLTQVLDTRAKFLEKNLLVMFKNNEKCAVLTSCSQRFSFRPCAEKGGRHLRSSNCRTVFDVFIIRRVITARREDMIQVLL